MKKIILNSLLCFLPFVIFSQNKYALLIGIDHYAPPQGYVPSGSVGRLNFPNLEGCINDVNAMYSVITSRFNFFQKDIDTLLNEKATRENILQSMDDLLKKCKPGDIAFIYYAGHGSRVKNSLSSDKPDKYDETIVPCDTWKENIPDIRDKELSKKFNAFLDNNIKLTIIFDCCHSGSISRGPNLAHGKLRYMPEENWDAKDSSRPQIPEKRPGNNFLSLFATQADKNAAEISLQDDSDHINNYGAFTHAITEALQQEPDDASASDIFTAARGILKNYGLSQEPEIGGSSERKNQNLFGTNKSQDRDYPSIAVSGIKGNKVTLEGGWALGLYKENELSYADNDSLFKLKIDKVTGVSQCIASVIEGNIANIKRGYLFKVTNWASPDIPLITIYIAHSDYTNEDVNKITSIASQIKRLKKTIWVENIRDANPYISIFFNGNKCFIKIDTASAKELKTITVQNILSFCPKDSTLYFELPVAKDTAEKFRKKLSLNHNIKIVDSAGLANYTLFGKLGKNDLPAYGFRKTETAAEDSLESMPIVTDCFEIQKNENKSVADSLSDMVKKLSKLRAWLSIIKTPQQNIHSFPFHLQFFNEDSKKNITDKYRIGDSVSISIVKDSNVLKNSIQQRFVYVFALDQSGKMSLYFPNTETNNGNKLPVYNNGQMVNTYPIDLGSYQQRIGPPAGTDNYFILTSDEIISDPNNVFNQEGVNTNVVSRGSVSAINPLYKLLNVGNDVKINGISRGGKLPAAMPSTWSLQKFSYKCTY